MAIWLVVDEKTGRFYAALVRAVLREPHYVYAVALLLLIGEGVPGAPGRGLLLPRALDRVLGAALLRNTAQVLANVSEARL